MKTLKLFLLTLSIPTLSLCQNNYAIEAPLGVEGTLGVYIGADPMLHSILTFYDTSKLEINSDTVVVPSINPYFFGVTGNNLISIDANGYLGVSFTSELPITKKQIIDSLGFTPYNSTNPNNYLNQSGVRTSISLTTTGNSGAATYNNSTGVFNIPNYTTTRTFNNNVSRSLNSNYTISTTQDAQVSYSINASWSINALLSGNGTAFLEYSTNGGSSWITVNQVSKTLTLLTIGGADDMNLTGMIPANALVRIRTTSSNMTVSYTRGQEVLF